jgi:hypothetical protein
MKQLAKRLIYRWMDTYIHSRAFDIDLQKQLDATGSSARYINRHAHKAEAFRDRGKLLEHAVKLAREQPGLVCEFGVWQGQSINLIASGMPNREVFGFDSFEGLPTVWRDEYKQGSFDVGGVLPAVKPNVQLVKGWFSDTLGPFLAEHPQPLALGHIDCDLYDSARTVLTTLRDRIGPGTILVFDEYFNYPGWQHHEYRAFQEFVRDTGIRYEYLAYNALHEQVIIRCTGSSQ